MATKKFFLARTLTLLLVIFLWPSFLWAALCPADRIDETVSVKKVVDGDTLQLLDGRKLRVIGINTPELSRRGKHAEPLADVAKQFVRTQIKNKPVILRFDKQRQDRYGRTLAHVFLQDGNSLSALLAKTGYGQAAVIAPNNWNVACYFKAEKAARNKRLGVWRQTRFKPFATYSLQRKHQGFYLIKGRVTRVGESRSAYWLQLARVGTPRIAIRIPKKHIRHFALDITTLPGREVEARGWLKRFRYKLQDELRLNISDGLMLSVK